MPKVILNGKEISLGETRELQSFLIENGFAEMHIAVAVNKTVVPKSLIAARYLEDGDRVEVLSPMAGG